MLLLSKPSRRKRGSAESSIFILERISIKNKRYFKEKIEEYPKKHQLECKIKKIMLEVSPSCDFANKNGKNIVSF